MPEPLTFQEALDAAKQILPDGYEIEIIVRDGDVTFELFQNQRISLGSTVDLGTGFHGQLQNLLNMATRK